MQMSDYFWNRAVSAAASYAPCRGWAVWFTGSPQGLRPGLPSRARFAGFMLGLLKRARFAASSWGRIKLPGFLTHRTKD